MLAYVDPHHKRVEFHAGSFHSQRSAEHTLVLPHREDGRAVKLIDRGSDIVGTVDGLDGELTVRQVQILEPMKWLVIDFLENPTLRRIVVHVEPLNVEALDTALRELLAEKPVAYYCRS